VPNFGSLINVFWMALVAAVAFAIGGKVTRRFT